MSWAGSRRRPRPLSLRLLAHGAATAALLVVVCVVWLRVLHTLTTQVEPPPPVGTPKALGWGDHAFTTKAQLEAWLRHRGLSYDVWASRHAAAVAVLEHRPVT